MVLNDQTRECACPRPVGTRGGCGAGWGPGACPGGSSIRWGSVRQDGRTPTRTSTRPPHPPHPAPCPYRTRDAHFPIRLSNLIRTLGTQAFRWCNYPIRLSNLIIGQWPVDALPRPINRRCANKLCAYGVFPMVLVKLHYRLPVPHRISRLKS